jgi:ABC-type sugar transport system ATPase subunit
MSRDIICKVNNVTKYFPGVVALKNVSFDIARGEVHAVVGENGAGKSTLMNILSGVYPADEGSVEFEGKTVLFSQPKEAQDAGIAMIHQELSLAPHMPAAENVYVGRMPKTKLGFIDRKKMNEDCTQYLRNLGISYINPKTLVKNLSVSEMQLLEIAKAISLDARMLIMDEPTSTLTTGEIEFLLKIVDGLRQKGVAILYISHKLEEVMKIADQITILRDGELIATKAKEDLDEQTMINLMVGRDFDQKAHREFIKEYEDKTPILEVKNLSDMSGKVKDVSFKLYQGEVLGLTGLVGAGRTELLQTIFGAQQMKSGTIYLNGEEIKIKSTEDALEKGIALIPEGRKIQGLFLKLSVSDNMTIARLKHLRGKLNFIDKKKTRALAMEYVDKLAIKTPSLNQIINNLSGGNQQKTIVARWLMNKPKILFMDEPTHGIDIGAKSEIYRIIDDLSKTGVSVILLSSELPEVLSMCDRIMVMHHGELRGILRHEEADQVKIMSYTLETAEEAKTAS